jgi:hypothetical protein
MALATVDRVKSWHPPLILLAVLGAAVAGFVLGGPGLGITTAGLCLVGLVVVALLNSPTESIGRMPHPESARRILIVSTVPIEDAATVGRLADEIDLGGAAVEAEIRILTPARPGFLDRWATDLRKARERAQRDLVISVATLALSGVTADAHVGDEDVGQAIEDELSEFDATEVYLVTAETGPEADQAVLRLADRVVPPLRPIRVSPTGDRNGVD